MSDWGNEGICDSNSNLCVRIFKYEYMHVYWMAKKWCIWKKQSRKRLCALSRGACKIFGLGGGQEILKWANHQNNLANVRRPSSFIPAVFVMHIPWRSYHPFPNQPPIERVSEDLRIIICRNNVSYPWRHWWRSPRSVQYSLHQVVVCAGWQTLCYLNDYHRL